MYFEIKAFNGTKRRFENLDNVSELNVFLDEWNAKGFNKFIIKSFDSDGFRKRRFVRFEGDVLIKMNFNS